MSRQLPSVLAGLLCAGLAAASGAQAATPSFELHPVAGLGLTVAVPRGWSVATPAARSGAALRLVARAPAASSGFHANLTVIVEPLPAGESLDGFLFAGASAAYRDVGTTAPVSAGGVRGLVYHSLKAVSDGRLPLLTDEYLFERHGQVLVITYTALARDRSRFETLFRASAQRLRLAGA
jgi:hypothetical protein